MTLCIVIWSLEASETSTTVTQGTPHTVDIYYFQIRQRNQQVTRLCGSRAIVISHVAPPFELCNRAVGVMGTQNQCSQGANRVQSLQGPIVQ